MKRRGPSLASLPPALQSQARRRYHAALIAAPAASGAATDAFQTQATVDNGASPPPAVRAPRASTGAHGPSAAGETAAPMITCSKCGQLAPRRGPTQRYCVPCSESRDQERKARWARANPLAPEKSREKAAKGLRHARVAGAAISRAHAEAITWDATTPVELEWMIRIAMPFDYGLSKNAIYRMGLKGHVTLRQETRQLRVVLEAKIRDALQGITPVQGKVWLDILVQKPNHKGDAVNVIDTVCDAAKKALGVDDRWFSIRRLDWQIVKTEPRLFLGIGQVSRLPEKVCACCGRSLPLDAFWGKKRKSRECIECRTARPSPTDDSQIDRLTLERRDVVPDGRLVVTITEDR